MAEQNNTSHYHLTYRIQYDPKPSQGSWYLDLRHPETVKVITLPTQVITFWRIHWKPKIIVSLPYYDSDEESDVTDNTEGYNGSVYDSDRSQLTDEATYTWYWTALSYRRAVIARSPLSDWYAASESSDEAIIARSPLPDWSVKRESSDEE